MTAKNELAANAARWATAAKNELPADVGFIMVFFPKDGVGGNAGVCVANVNNEGVMAQLKDTLRRYNEQPKIWTPGGGK